MRRLIERFIVIARRGDRCLLAGLPVIRARSEGPPLERHGHVGLSRPRAETFFLPLLFLVLLVAVSHSRGQSTGICTSDADCEDGNACTQDICDDRLRCAYLPTDCNDGTSCTDDSCDPTSGQCAHSDNGSCVANPKSLGYWQRVCRGTGNIQDAVTQSDVSWLQAHSCAYGPPMNAPLSVEVICRILTNK